MSEQGTDAMYRRISQCRICGNTHLVEVLDLGVQALTGVFPKTRAQQIVSGPLRLVKCIGDRDTCGLLQLQHTYDLGDLYGENYGYRSGLNASMVKHLHAKVQRIIDRVTLPRGALVIDVGANDSTTLQAYPKQGCVLVGVDPTADKFSRFYPSHIQPIPEFFSAATVRRHFGNRNAEVITSFSMFYDLENPLRFMQEVYEVLADEGIWVFEQSYMPTMLRRNSYDTVCHEHLEYYALKQIKWMADRAGLKIIDVEFNDINGGSFSVTVAKRSSCHADSPDIPRILDQEECDGLDTLRPYQDFADRVTASKLTLRKFIDRAKQAGESISGIGASTKGNVLLQYCNVTDADIVCIGEVNPEKFQAFTPGTFVPIVSEEEMLSMHPDYALVLPWHFRNFFVKQAKFERQSLVFPLPELDIIRRADVGETAAGT